MRIWHPVIAALAAEGHTVHRAERARLSDVREALVLAGRPAAATGLGEGPGRDPRLAADDRGRPEPCSAVGRLVRRLHGAGRSRVPAGAVGGRGGHRRDRLAGDLPGEHVRLPPGACASGSTAYLATDREFLESASPLSRVDDIRAPLFVIHGANDPRVPLSEAEQITAALEKRGVPCELARLPGRGPWPGQAARTSWTPTRRRSASCGSTWPQWSECRGCRVEPDRQPERYGEVQVLVADRRRPRPSEGPSGSRRSRTTSAASPASSESAEVTDHEASHLVEPAGPQQLCEQPVDAVPLLADVFQYDDARSAARRSAYRCCRRAVRDCHRAVRRPRHRPRRCVRHEVRSRSVTLSGSNRRSCSRSRGPPPLPAARQRQPSGRGS